MANEIRKFHITQDDIDNGIPRESFDCAIAVGLKPYVREFTGAGPLMVSCDGWEYWCSAKVGMWINAYDGVGTLNACQPFVLCLDNRTEVLLRYHDSAGQVYAVRGQAYMEDEEPEPGGER